MSIHRIDQGHIGCNHGQTERVEDRSLDSATAFKHDLDVEHLASGIEPRIESARKSVVGNCSQRQITAGHALEQERTIQLRRHVTPTAAETRNA